MARETVAEAMARDVADTIKAYGNNFTLADGKTKVRAYINENIDSMKRTFGKNMIDNSTGRLVLFRFTPEEAEKIPEGALLTYDGERFTQSTRRTMRQDNYAIQVVILGESGGVA